jgi:hypothetical protein
MGETIHKVAPGARLIRLSAPPVIGGVLFAMQINGLNTKPLRENLLTSIELRNREV